MIAPVWRMRLPKIACSFVFSQEKRADMNMQERSRYSRARCDKDRSFDGKFFFGVRTTGIFCRPSCRTSGNARWTKGRRIFFRGSGAVLSQCQRSGSHVSRGIRVDPNEAEALKRAVRAVLDGLVSLSPNQSFESFREAFVALKGVGDWTANYMAMRGLGMIDAFPAADLGIIKAMTRNGRRPSVGQILEQSEAWRPYRAYAALCLWNIKEN